jgi:hypothetical protein
MKEEAADPTLGLAGLRRAAAIGRTNGTGVGSPVVPASPTLPVIRLCGTGQEALVDQQRAVGLALHKALEAMAAAYPNGRDYADPVAFRRAVAEHDARMARVRASYLETQAICQAIADL